MHRISRWSLAILLGTALVFVSCARKSAAPDDFQRMTAAAAAYYAGGTKEITAEQLWAELNDADTTQPYVISVRALCDDTARGHIPTAHHWDPASLLRHKNQLPKGKKIVLYCYTGQSSSFCTALLNLAGYDAYSLRWGICAWTADTTRIGRGGGWHVPAVGHQELETTPRPLTAEYAPPAPKAKGETVVDLFCANLEPEIRKPAAEWKQISAADVYANLEDHDPANDYFVVFCGPEAVYKAGHIPGARYIDSRSLGSVQSLRRLPPDKPIVVYCMNGNHAMQVVALLNALGYDAWSLKRGLGAITDRADILGQWKFTPPAKNFPVVSTPLDRH